MSHDADDDLVELCLELDEVDVTSFDPVAATVAARGIRIDTLAEEYRRDPQALDRLYALAQVVHRNATWTLEEYLKRFDDWEAVFIARSGDLYVGYSYLCNHEQHLGHLHQSMTGVRPAYRRQGIATALKARGIAYAKQHGFARIITRIHRDNEPSLAMNRKMGFR